MPAMWLGLNDANIGTCDAYDFILKAGNTHSIWIKPNGNVGIGTPNAATKLYVETNQVNDGIHVQQTTSGFSALRLFNSSSGGRNWAMVSTGNGNGEGAGNFGIYDYTAGGYKMFMLPNGNTGFGTTTPLSRIHVNGNALITNTTGVPVSAAFIRGNSNQSTALTPEYTWWNNDQTGFFHPAANTIGITLGGTEAARFFQSGFNLNMQVAYGGSQLIVGTQKIVAGPHTNFKLSVDGKLVAKSIFVTMQNWADYVFADDYKPMSLYEVEAYYKTNKHLPEIPSEAEVLENGIDVGEMNKLLLKKIEEMTVLMVQQQKEIDELKSIIKH